MVLGGRGQGLESRWDLTSRLQAEKMHYERSEGARKKNKEEMK
jgi:hypothetical protein